MNSVYLNPIDSDQLSSIELENYIQKIKDIAQKTEEGVKIYSENNSIRLVASEKDKGLFDQMIGRESEISSGEAEVVHDYVVFNKNLYQFIRVEEFPTDRGLGFLALKGIGDYFIHFKKIPAKKSRKMVEFFRRTNFAGSQSDLRNIESEKGLDLSDELLEKIITSEEDLFQAEIWFFTQDEDIRELRKKSKNLVKALNDVSISSEIETYSLSYAFEHFVGKNKKLKRPMTMHSSFLINLLPLSRDYLMSEGINFTSRSGAPLEFNLFDQSSNSYGVTISGTTGLGKSKLGNKIIFEEVANGTKVVILDRNGSYRKMCNYVSGQELPYKFNPLIYKDPLYLKSLLISAIPPHELNKRWEGELFLELQKMDLSKIDSMGQLISNLSDEFAFINSYFAEILECFDDSSISEVDFLYVDFAKYPETVLAPLLVFIIRHFYTYEGKKIILMDECHHLLKNNIDFVEKMFRELRKQMGAPIALTQNYSDFISTRIGEVIANNSFYKIFFRQNIELSSFIDEFDRDHIHSVNTAKGYYSEFYLKTEKNRKVLRYVPTPFEYELFTSDYSDNLNQKKYFEYLLQSGFEYPAVMDSWVKVRYAMD